MPKIKVQFTADLRIKTGMPGTHIELEGEGIPSLCSELGKAFPAIREELTLPDDREDYPYLVMVNGEYVNPDDFDTMHLKEGDEVLFLRPLAGG